MADRQASRTHQDDDERQEQHRERRSEREERPRRRASDGADADGDRPRSSRRARRGGLTAGEVARLGMTEIAELTGRQPEGVTGVERTEDGWLVGVEVVEIQRIPSSSDLLATYEAELNPDGELVSYRRTKRYSRGREDNGDE